MIKLKAFSLSAFFLVSWVSCSQRSSPPEVVKPEAEAKAEVITLADPTIFHYEDTYYLYGTSQGELSYLGGGFLVYTSSDLINWEGPKGAHGGLALRKGDAFGTEGFWAPQVFEYEGNFYMAYTANENIAIATSDSPLGPFTNSGQPLEAPVKQIDPFVYIADDEKKYLYHVRLGEGNKIYVVEMNDDLMSIKPETLTHCISAEEEWEDTQQVEWPVAEGPTIIKEEGLYYLLYSANDFRNPDYAVGYATSNSPLGPWKKFEGSPIIKSGSVGESGPGHGDVFFDKNGTMQYVLHTHFSEVEVHPRKTALIKLNFQNGAAEKTIKAESETFRFLETNENK